MPQDGLAKCVALHTLTGTEKIDEILLVKPKEDYSEVHGEALLPYCFAAVNLVKQDGRFSRPVFAEALKQLKAGKLKAKKLPAKQKAAAYFCGFKSVSAFCKHIGISPKHFYNVINDNRSGRKLLTAAEREKRDEEIKTRRDRRKIQRAEDRKAEIADAVKPHIENERILTATVTHLEAEKVSRQASEPGTQAVYEATTDAAQVLKPSSPKQKLVTKKTRNAGNEPITEEEIVVEAAKTDTSFLGLTAPQTPRDIYFYNLGATSNVKPRTRASYEPPITADTDDVPVFTQTEHIPSPSQTEIDAAA